MEFVNIIAFCAVLIPLTMAPGPLTTVLAARSIGPDVTGAVYFGVGAAVGDMLVVSMICAGLGLWLQAMPEVFEAAKFVALAYLGWIAYGIWNAPPMQEEGKTGGRSSSLSSSFSGMFTCIISPQTVLVYLLILPALVDVSNISLPTFGALNLLTFAVRASSLLLVVFLADRFSKLLGSQENSTTLNRILASATLLSGIWMVST